jgi:hypothetical protein
MPASIYTQTEHNFIKKHYPLKGAGWVADKTGRRIEQIKAYAKNHKLKRTNYRMTVANARFISENINTLDYYAIAQAIGETVKRVQGYVYKNKLSSKTWLPYSEDEKQYIMENFRRMSYKELAESIGRHREGIRHYVREYLKLHRTAEDRKALCQKFSSPQYFKKGHLTWNTKFDGYISKRQDSHGIWYKYIRIAPGKFDLLHRFNWESKYGSIPEGKILRSVNGDTLNCDPDNWELIDMKINLEKNSGRKELTDIYVARNLSMEGRGLVNKDMVKEILTMPEIIELKRSELKLRREINEQK